MPKAEEQVNLGKASIKFLVVTIVVVALTLLVSIIIVWINRSFTLWAIVPLLVGFPASILINITIAKKSAAPTQQDLGEQSDEILE